MPSRNIYEKTLCNNYLGEIRVIKATTLSELKLKEQNIYSRWDKLVKTKKTKAK